MSEGAARQARRAPAPPVAGRCEGHGAWRAGMRLAGRRRSAAFAAAALLLSAGCDQGAEVIEISGLRTTPAFDRTVFRPGSVAAELHNPAPLPGATLESTAGLIELPDGMGAGMDLPVVAPGGWARSEHGRPIRLALIFDPEAPAAGAELCSAEAPLPSDPPERGEDGAASAYGVQMALCFRDEAIAEGRMEAQSGQPLDAAFVTRTLKRLFSEAFGA